MADNRHATSDYPILPVLAERWSPTLLSPRPVEAQKLLCCLEAARWAPSSFNEQPWSFLVSTREDSEQFRRMLGCLVKANQQWAQNAGVLLITVARRTFTGNGKPNRVAEHDIGLAAANLTVQATALGLYVHQMGGIDIPKVRYTYRVPEGFDPVTAIALGYLAEATDSNNPLVQRDQAPRSRKQLAEFVFADTWQQPASQTLDGRTIETG